MSHLKPEAAAALEWTQAQRIHYAQQVHWIPYSRAKEIIESLEDLMVHARRQRMPNTLIVGESGNGKSTVIRRLAELHPPTVAEATGKACVPVVVVEMPPEPNESRFWTELLWALRVCHRATDPAQKKEAQALSVLDTVGTKLLVIDELHNLLHGGGARQRAFLAVLKRLSNKLNLPIVGVGVRDAVFALHTDPQLRSRFEHLELPKWELNEEFLRLLKSFEQRLPVAEPSNLHSKELAMAIHGLTDRTIGSVSMLLSRATVKAIRDGSERITVPLLEAAAWKQLDSKSTASI